jgi:hypothetical protein
MLILCECDKALLAWRVAGLFCQLPTAGRYPAEVEDEYEYEETYDHTIIRVAIY